MGLTTRRDGRRLSTTAEFVLAALVVVLFATSCGSRRPDEELLSAVRGNTTSGEEAGSVAGVGNATGAGTGSAPGVTSGGATGGGASSVAGPGGATTNGGGRSTTESCIGRLEPIVIGSVGTQSGLIGQLIGNGPKAVEAWVAEVNANGGLHCHPVEYIVADDGGDPSAHHAAVRRLVEEEHVIALVHVNAPLTGNASIGYLTQRNIPVIGSEGASNWFYDSPMYFTQSSSGPYTFESLVASVARAGAARGLTRFGQAPCIEAPICSSLNTLTPRYAEKYGFEFVYSAQVSLVQPDFTAVCQGAQRANAQMLLPGLDTNSIIRMVRNCDSIGYHPLYITGTSLAVPALADNERSEGTLIAWTAIPPYRTDNESIGNLERVIATRSPGLTLDATTVLGWVSAQLFARAAQNISDPPTSQSILEGLWSVQNDDLGGITAPLTFTRGQNSPPSVCYWTAVIADREFRDYGDGSRTCEQV